MRNGRIGVGQRYLPHLLAGSLLFPTFDAHAHTSPCPSGGPQRQDTAAFYFRESPPRTEPRLFAKGIVSTSEGMYGTVVFSPGLEEAFWVKDEHPGLFFSRLVDGGWTAPEEFPFGEGFRLNSPVFSPDGGKLYVLVARRGSDGVDRDDRIWVMDREGEGWGDPREADPEVNAVKKHFQFSVDQSGAIYFGGEGADIYVSELRNGVYLRPERLPGLINTDAPETSPHISPDGSLLLFDRWFQESPWVRIMASFRGSDGEWSEPVDLSPYTKSEGNDSGARLSPDGNYLFFQSVREGSDQNRSVYWMEAGFLEELRRTSGSSPALGSAGNRGKAPWNGESQALPYLGESPPGSTPIPFAHHILTRELHSPPVFSPGMDEVFWNEMEGGTIRFMEVQNGAWTEPRDAPFSLPYSGEPVFGPRGNTLYFFSGHRFQGSQGESDENLWKVTRTPNGWSDPEPLGAPVNDHPMHWGATFAANGNLYFGQTAGSGGIFLSEYRYGRYQEPSPLSPAVNTEDMETTPCVARNESFLVFSRVVEHGRGPIDLYVSFRSEDGSWREAVPLAGVNSEEREISPRLSPDGRYLFFLRTLDGELRPFWVSTTIIEDLRPR